MEAAFPLGVLAGLFEFIPTVGPLLSAVPAMAMGFLDSPQKAPWVALAYWGIQFLENHILIPLLMKGVDLPAAHGRHAGAARARLRLPRPHGRRAAARDGHGDGAGAVRGQAPEAVDSRTPTRAPSFDPDLDEALEDTGALSVLTPDRAWPSWSARSRVDLRVRETPIERGGSRTRRCWSSATTSGTDAGGSKARALELLLAGVGPDDMLLTVGSTVEARARRRPLRRAAGRAYAGRHLAAGGARRIAPPAARLGRRDRDAARSPATAMIRAGPMRLAGRVAGFPRRQ